MSLANYTEQMRKDLIYYKKNIENYKKEKGEYVPTPVMTTDELLNSVEPFVKTKFIPNVGQTDVAQEKNLLISKSTEELKSKLKILSDNNDLVVEFIISGLNDNEIIILNNSFEQFAVPLLKKHKDIDRNIFLIEAKNFVKKNYEKLPEIVNEIEGKTDQQQTSLDTLKQQNIDKYNEELQKHKDELQKQTEIKQQELEKQTELKQQELEKQTELKQQEQTLFGHFNKQEIEIKKLSESNDTHITDVNELKVNIEENDKKINDNVSKLNGNITDIDELKQELGEYTIVDDKDLDDLYGEITKSAKTFQDFFKDRFRTDILKDTKSQTYKNYDLKVIFDVCFKGHLSVDNYNIFIEKIMPKFIVNEDKTKTTNNKYTTKSNVNLKNNIDWEAITNQCHYDIKLKNNINIFYYDYDAFYQLYNNFIKFIENMNKIINNIRQNIVSLKKNVRSLLEYIGTNNEAIAGEYNVNFKNTIYNLNEFLDVIFNKCDYETEFIKNVEKFIKENEEKLKIIVDNLLVKYYDYEKIIPDKIDSTPSTEKASAEETVVEVDAKGLSSDGNNGNNKVYVDMKLLNKKNILSLKYHKTKNQHNTFKPVFVGDELKHIIQLYIDGHKISKNNIEELNSDDKKIFNKFNKIYKKYDENEEEQEQFKILLGEVRAGNDSDIVKASLKKYILKFLKEKKLSKNIAISLMEEIE